ncbi:myosin-binding protein 1-like protein [Tanacetum coccineum]
MVTKAKNKTGVYWDSICDHHKSEISSVVLCNVHDKRVSRDCADNVHPASPIGGSTKNEKNIFVDESLESRGSSNIGKNQVAPSSDIEYQEVNVTSDDGSAHTFVPEVHLKSDLCFGVHDLQNDSATVATRNIEGLKWRDDAIKEDTSRVTELISFDEVPSFDNVETPADASVETTDHSRTDQAIKDPIIETEVSATTNGHQVLNHLELGDAYKLAISSKARQLSGKYLDQKSFKESSTRASEDLKNLLSHRSNDNLISPKLSFNGDEFFGLQFFQRKISLERNESNISVDGSVVSEIDGESVVDRLKRQVEHDKKLMGILYKELEEERNASAVATNQAMAMITRLQEEKSALYTEALQSLRMLEEQAEYDNEALQRANDLIEQKDKQIQDLEELLRNTSQDYKETTPQTDT